MASFRQRSKKWEYRIKYTDPATGKTKEKTKGGFRTKKEAQIEAGEVEKQLYLGQHTIIKSKEILVKDWLTQWLQVYGTQCEPSTFRTRKFYTEKHLINHLGYYKLNQLTKLDYQKFINTLLTKYAKRTVQTIHSIFCTAINKAVDLEMLSHNKFRFINIKKEDDNSHLKNNFLTKEEVDIFLDAAKTSPLHHYMFVFLTIRTGLRKGEALALTWDDIDLENKTISVAKSRGTKNGLKAPKTKSSIRTISIDTTLINELKSYRTWQKKNKLKYGQAHKESEFMLTNRNGSELTEFGVNKIVASILKKTNLHHISPHGLRHTHAIMLLESGADIKTVSTRLGHTSIDMTANVYLHITKKHEEASVLNLEVYLNN
ncbi:site-specific integrase [Bacillus sp. ISL-46]|uniref:site-specific integrase n=1 Tax=Bacillus sp. ISL-46 TaxID=2819129 RepID=UPI001BEAB09F|nr:site-specific integrase [Bacillus sp. ISL-46]MBT2722273.1 site-specific integrase [Bacillus sp. ISL-46]